MKTKDRLTITLSKDIIKQLDRFIDGDTIRNRSHAIEFILGKQLGSAVKKCVILAGGQTEQCLNPLRRVLNRPVIAYQIEMLKEIGIKELIIVTSKNSKDVKDYLGSGHQWGMDIQYITEPKENGTASALKLAEPYLKNTFLLLYGDVLAEIDLLDFIEAHKANENSLATLAISYKENAHKFGICKTKGTNIIDYLPKSNKPSRHKLVNIGMAVMSPQIFKYIGKNTKSLSSNVYAKLAVQDNLSGYTFSGKWFNVSYKDEYSKAKKEWK